MNSYFNTCQRLLSYDFRYFLVMPNAEQKPYIFTLLSSDKEWPRANANFTGAHQKVEKKQILKANF